MALEIYTIDDLSNTKWCYLPLKKAKVTFHITIKVCYQLSPVHYKQDGMLEILKACCVGGETFKRRLAGLQCCYDNFRLKTTQVTVEKCRIMDSHQIMIASFYCIVILIYPHVIKELAVYTIMGKILLG